MNNYIRTLFLGLSVLLTSSGVAFAESGSEGEAGSGEVYDHEASSTSEFDTPTRKPGDGSWDWDLFDGEGWTPRYAYLDFDNMIGYAHYAGLGYYHKAGAELSGMVFRYGHGTIGKKYNIAYSNSFSFMSVDFGLSYHVLDDDNPRTGYEDLELLGLEMGLRFWVVQVIGTVAEETSFVTLGYGF